MGGTNPELVLEFGASVQSVGALQAAAYRLIGSATCQIDQVAGRLVCRIIPVSRPNRKAFADAEALRTHFLQLVADENLRERIAARTDGVRDVILALAFGSLAHSQSDRP
jgi:His-Xaa-Ser system protein HxsD